jgi:hypothetical protein
MNRKDQVPEVNAARANKLAFTTEHAFHDFFFQLLNFPPLNEGMDQPDVEIREMAGRTGGSAASAAHAEPDRRFSFVDKPGHFPVIRIEINLPVFADRIAKRFHPALL